MKCPSRTYFMHTLLQLIPSKAAVFFISDENLGWLPITLLLIISFSFDLHYDCSVRRTHLFISFARREEFFGDCTDCCTWKMSLEAGGIPCASAHMVAAFTLCAFKPWISSSLLWEAPTIVQFTFSPPIFGGCIFFASRSHTHTLPLKALIC